MIEEQNIKQIPKDWKWVSIGDVAEINPKIPNRDFISDDLEVQFLPMKLVEELSGKIHLTETRLYGEVKKGYTPFINNDVLFAKVTPCMENGKIAVVDNLRNEIGFGSSEFHVLRSKDNLLNKYAFYFILQQRFRNDAEHAMTGAVGLRRVPKQFIESYKLPFPSISQQQQIVSKIEELFSELDKGIEELKTAQQQLKVYRQAVLKWAFEGKLTNEDVKEGELPEGWKVEPLGKLMESVRNGYSKKPDGIGDYNILRISSVRPNKVDFSEVRLLLNDAGDDNSVSENDLLFTRYNGSIDFVGVCGRVPKLASKLFYPDKLIRCRPLIKEAYHSAYLEYASNYGSARKFVLSRIKTTAGQTGISGSDLKQIPIPVAPPEEQQQIVQEIESRLSVCDKIEETITNSLKQAEALRQSILKKAFEGKLV